jgi:UDP-N-acetylglucosamine transferase subunit ALG13
VIFASLGTHGQPFHRALDLLLELPASERVTAQVGITGCRHAPNLTCYDYLGFDEMQECMRSASAVVSHAGVGTIVTALEFGHTPVVIPRLRALGEHVDDHQVELATVLDGRGLVVCYREGDSLADLITHTRTLRARSPLSKVPGDWIGSGGSALGDAVRADVEAALSAAHDLHRRRRQRQD